MKIKEENTVPLEEVREPNTTLGDSMIDPSQTAESEFFESDNYVLSRPLMTKAQK